MNTEYIDEHEAVKYANSIGLKVSVHKLRKDRINNRGIIHYKFDGKVYYTKADIDSHIQDGKIIPKGR